ncbi:MAG: CDP-diacylglycerol--glycerol-3-phosphate 3-phosphatidyltransferase [Alphaproteobacteria bacterium]|nr:CDP-diacylglycerol--glycerol-3-phosphate 3-phosphatidyltransferase [Alphaproteobacteria bacterium]
MLQRLPLYLTLFRIIAAPIVAGLVLWAHAIVFTDGAGRAALIYAIAGVLFVAAAATDFLDGWIARRFDAVTPLGAALDHAADKALVAGTLIALAYALLRWDLVLAAVLLVVRDVAVAGLREGLSGSGRTLPVSSVGKLKAGAEMIAVAGFLFLPALSFAEPGARAVVSWAAVAALWAAVALALISAAGYVRAALVPPAANKTG